MTSHIPPERLAGMHPDVIAAIEAEQAAGPRPRRKPLILGSSTGLPQAVLDVMDDIRTFTTKEASTTDDPTP